LPLDGSMQDFVSVWWQIYKIFKKICIYI